MPKEKMIKLTKLKGLQIGFILLLVLFLLFLLPSKNYAKEYLINDIKIKEVFQKENKSYYFTFVYKDQELDYLITHKYLQHRGLIKDVEVVEYESDFCLIIKSDYLNFFPLCQENGISTHFSIVDEELKQLLPNQNIKKEENVIDEYENISIYNKDYTYLIWKYDGFYMINKNSFKDLALFAKENYNVSLVGYTADYLVIADYDNTGFTFNKLYTINLKKGNIKSYKLNRDIYFDSSILGYDKNNLYLVDNKASVMLEFNANKGTIQKTKAKVLINGNWENTSIKTLVNKASTFTYKSNYHYYLDNSDLYFNYTDKYIETKVSTNIKRIVRIKDNEVFYIKDYALYVFNPLEGEKKLLENYEWNFNYDSTIYVN